MSKFSLHQYISHLPSQRNVGCCTASASLVAAEMILSTVGIKERLSRLYVYYMSRKLQGRLGNHGAELKGTLEAMKQGIATDRTWPFHTDWVNIEPSLMSVLDAEQFHVDEYAWADTSTFKDYLHTEVPVIIGFRMGNLFRRLHGTIEEQIYKPINNSDNRIYGNHAVAIIGYDDSICGGSWIVANSMGLSWGDHGIGILPYECKPDIGESYVITKFAGISPGKKFLKIDK